MKKIFILSFLFISITSLNNLKASDYASYGFVSCGDFLMYIDTNRTDLSSEQVSWVLGYLSGYNSGFWVADQDFDMYALPDEAGIYYSIEKYCRDNPLADINEVAIDILVQGLPIAR